MSESGSPWIPSCNGSIRVALDGQRATSDSGALLLREALVNSGVIEMPVDACQACWNTGSDGFLTADLA
jgi:hypothetical protein